MPKPTYFVDDRLVPRIKQILRACNGRASVSYLTEELQTQYGEYARKKKNALVKSVEKGLAVARKELQKEGIQISTNGSSSSDSEADFEADQHKGTNIMNSMIINMYKQGQPTTPISGHKVVNSAYITSVSSSVDSQRSSPKLSGAHAESNDFRSRESLKWCIDRKSNTSTPAEKMELDASHNNSIHLATGHNHIGLVDGDASSDKNVENVDSAKSGQPKKRRRESPDGLKRKKQKKPVYPDVTFSDVGGNESVLEHLRKRCYFLKHPALLQLMKNLPRSFLFHGPTGCGKSLLAKSIAGEYKVPLLSVTATELVGGISGDSEANIRDLFNQAAELAPCILLIDDVDAIATKRETATKGMESRVVTQLSSSMDDLKSKNLPVLMICTTSRPNSLDEAFRRTERFDLEFALRYPNRDARKSILQTLCQGVPLAEDVSLSAIADLTPGFVGSDLKSLIISTNACTLHRAISEYVMRKQTNVVNGSTVQDVEFTQEDICKLDIARSMADFQEAMIEVKPTAKQEDVILVPSTTWDDIGGLNSIRDKLNLCIMERTKRPELYQALGMTSALGVLLVGPPGCGKTSVARAVANEAGINFLYIKGPELLNKYVGESEKNVRDLFKKAGSLAPCIIFFDEIDSICPKRSSGSEEGSASRVTNQLLLEMSGLEQRTEVYIMAATNKLDCLDPALLRPGRMDKIIYVGLPSPEGRVEILKAHTKNGMRPKLADDVDLDYIGKDRRCNGFSGADLGNLVQVAREACMEQIIKSTDATHPFVMPVVNKDHFETAFKSVSASVGAEAKKNYEAVKRLLENRTDKKDMAEIIADSRSDVRPSKDLA
ncbi:unnamed protein product [Candidula unifasciata]|uniref:AAA+ ATPase domain-containing protein n=1 Tax=Candidula unifasciata TaxID=100452 RepID=A0A8S3Z9P4_9EUPU|nr:unnamed protein product [Candidula unifasciata]